MRWESHHAGSSISLIRVTAVVEKSRGWEKKDRENLISCSSEEFFVQSANRFSEDVKSIRFVWKENSLGDRF